MLGDVEICSEAGPHVCLLVRPVHLDAHCIVAEWSETGNQPGYLVRELVARGIWARFLGLEVLLIEWRWGLRALRSEIDADQHAFHVDLVVEEHIELHAN